MIQTEKQNSDKKLESILVEFNEKLTKEKEIVLSNVDGHIKSLLEQVGETGGVCWTDTYYKFVFL